MIKASATNGSFTVAVRDTGPGISTADQGKIFEGDGPTTPPPRRRARPGLSISRRIVEMHERQALSQEGRKRLRCSRSHYRCKCKPPARQRHRALVSATAGRNKTSRQAKAQRSARPCAEALRRVAGRTPPPCQNSIRTHEQRKRPRRCCKIIASSGGELAPVFDSILANAVRPVRSQVCPTWLMRETCASNGRDAMAHLRPMSSIGGVTLCFIQNPQATWGE